ncbi:hypothetical protein SCLCIDRAFT_1209244 [Scleroderma citrinum Foug A]|uniref:G-patch domain-containing protein n=1 Tax=Scleroderma citrinum Foug A TaxID=1036808 RepID=A0A0C3EJK6_9AGAM|nr:hypothetical protein SCLCIDRAFT_1209244 [Scleroderma citrinum Foug A]
MKSLEEGEVLDSALLTSSKFEYDPAYEWQGDNDPGGVAPTAWPLFRLLVLQSTILHKHLRIAVLDAYGEVQFGRDRAPDGSETPRVRLKEMEVSKLHATAYWDKERQEWAVVDMGSKHGTFLQSGRQSDAKPTRLSPPRVASIPRPLRHLDRLIIGTTTFVCHVHEDRRPCVECMSSGQSDIPLFNIPNDSGRITGKRTDESNGSEPQTNQGRDPKRALTTLKRALLLRLERTGPQLPSTQPTTTYLDRSARRRAMHPGSQYDSPGVQSPRDSSPGTIKLSHESAQQVVPQLSAVHVEESRTPSTLPAGNIGRQLLLKQGWQPGTVLGSSADEAASGLIEPIEVTMLPPRAGLGMPEKPVSSHRSFGEWKETEKDRRWESMRDTMRGPS